MEKAEPAQTALSNDMRKSKYVFYSYAHVGVDEIEKWYSIYSVDSKSVFL